ncbi:MAG TPA: hypothetical protein VIT68_02115 [Candidatus Gracilibacteria bacterium]
MNLQNQYLIMRHDRSKPNEQGIIISSLENGVLSQYGLAQSDGAAIEESVTTSGLSKNIIIVSSPFSRTMETAEIRRLN